MVLVGCAYVTPDVLVRSVGRGFLLLGAVVGASAGRGGLWHVGRVLHDVLCVGMGAVCLVFV